MSDLEIIYWIGNTGGILFLVFIIIYFIDQEQIIQKIKKYINIHIHTPDYVSKPKKTTNKHTKRTKNKK